MKNPARHGLVRHLPNLLTLLRLVSVPVTLWLMTENRLAPAFWLFAAAGLTDAVDGAVARLFDARSALGAVLDPLADKVLLVSTYVALGLAGQLPLWLMVLVVLRDVLIVAYAVVYALAGRPHGSPSLISKINTLAQITLAGVVLAGQGLHWGGPMLVEALVVVVAVTTIASGTGYLLAASRNGTAANGGGGRAGVR